MTPKKKNSSSRNGIKSRLHLGPMSAFKPWCPYLTPRTPSLPWPKVPAPRAPQRVRLELSRPPSQATCLWHVYSPGASPGLVTGCRACRRAEEGVRQELSLSGGCLVTLMENELWGPNPRSHSRSWRARRKARVPQQGEGPPPEELSRAPVCRWWRGWAEKCGTEGGLGPGPGSHCSLSCCCP